MADCAHLNEAVGQSTKKKTFFSTLQIIEKSKRVRTFALVLKFHNCVSTFFKTFFLAHSFLIELILDFFPTLTKLFSQVSVIMIHKLNSFESHHRPSNDEGRN